MKYVLIIIATIFILMVIIANYAQSQEDLDGVLLIDFSNSTAKYTETHVWKDEVTAHVEKSECNSCLDYTSLEECKNLFKTCLEINN